MKRRSNKAAIMYNSSLKCHHVTRSVLRAELYAFTDCLDYVLALAHDLSAILRRKVNTIMFTDLKSLFDTSTKLSTVSEMRLLIEIATICDDYTNVDLSNIAHTNSKVIIESTFTNPKADDSMPIDLMHTEKLSHPISQWIIPQ